MRSGRVTRSIPGVWRWRRNPMRRPSDVFEAWAGLTAVVVAAVAAPLTGLAAGHSVDTALRHLATVQRSQRHMVTATVEGTDHARGGIVDPDESDDQAAGHRILVGWRAPDGSAHTAVVSVVGRHARGTRLALWTDRRDRPVGAPLDLATATSNAVAAGFGAAVAVAALVMAVRHLLGWRILRRRLADWEREWIRVSQDWGRAGAGG